jgi:glucokinase
MTILTPEPPRIGRRPGAAGDLWLVGDIGGTHARFAIYESGDVAPGDGALSVRSTLLAADHGEFAAAISRYLADAGVEPGALRGASFAIPSPVTDDEICFTNSPWRFSRRELSDDLRLRQLVLVNDFEALALRTPHMKPGEVRPLRRGTANADAPRVIVGPGTGLGVAAVIATGTGAGRAWHPIAGEGGHASFAPVDEFETDLLRHLRDKHGRVSAERVLCGEGLVTLYAFLLARSGATRLRPATAAEITREAQSGEATAREAVMRFLAILGSVAGDCALLYGARGGVYFAGGIVPRLSSLLAESDLHARFDAKGRMSSWIKNIPLHLVADDAAALRGAAIAALHPVAGTDEMTTRGEVE